MSVKPSINAFNLYSTYVKLKVLDTAGPEQFIALKEVYIKVRSMASHSVEFTHQINRQSGRGFVLFFRQV